MREGSIVACGSPEKLINSHSFLRDVNKDKSIVLIFIQRHYLILDRFGMIRSTLKVAVIRKVVIPRIMKRTNETREMYRQIRPTFFFQYLY